MERGYAQSNIAYSVLQQISSVYFYSCLPRNSRLRSRGAELQLGSLVVCINRSLRRGIHGKQNLSAPLALETTLDHPVRQHEREEREAMHARSARTRDKRLG